MERRLWRWSSFRINRVGGSVCEVRWSCILTAQAIHGQVGRVSPLKVPVSSSFSTVCARREREKTRTAVERKEGFSVHFSIGISTCLRTENISESMVTALVFGITFSSGFKVSCVSRYV